MDKKIVKKLMSGKYEVSVVVPVYNSEKSLPLLYQRLAAVFSSQKITSWQLVLVNDCSPDNSWEAIVALTKKYDNITAANLRNNFGQHNAIMCGFSYAEGEYIITMDDDLQHPPEEIPKLVNTLRKGYDVVYGQYQVKQHGFFRDLCSRAVNQILSKITGTGYGVTSFRALRLEVVRELVRFTSFSVMVDVHIKDIVSSRSVGHCVVEHHPRTIGKSNYSYKKLFWYALNMIFNYTVWPLRLTSILGFLFSAVSVGLGIFYIIYYFIYGISVSGWTSLSLMVTFFFGILFFVMGIVGEYVGRIFLTINKKPQYVIREVIHNESHNTS